MDEEVQLDVTVICLINHPYKVYTIWRLITVD